MRVRRLAVAVLIAALGAAHAHEDPPNPSLVPPAPLNEQVLRLSGDPDRPVDLTVTLYTPDGPGPFPLVVMNHGSSGDQQAHAAAPRYRFTMSAYYFLSRGYAVALPMMRGYAGSSGHQENYGCNFAEMATDNGRDIAGVIASLSSDRRFDTSRVLVAGQSFGGWNTLGLGALRPAGVRGLVNFSGGIKTSVCDSFQDGDSKLEQAAGVLGQTTSLPSIWFYGENDSLFDTDVWRAMHDAYTRHGAHAELVDIGRFMDDSHQMLSRPESLPFWVPRLDAFLSRIGMPGREVLPAYMPTPWPRPTHFAEIGNVAAAPVTSESGRDSYRKFLAAKFPRVFVVAPGGQAATAQGGFDPLARALGLCRKAGFACLPYAIDEDVVFTPPPVVPRPATSRFATLSDVGAVPWVNDKGRDAYRNFLTHASPRAFVIGTGGETAVTFGGADPLSRAMAMCASAQLDCHPYAVDDSVVWVRPPPAPRPPRATGYAALDDLAAVPWVTPQSRALYSRFLTAELPRAFVVAPGGQAALTQGGYDPLGRALTKCRDKGLVCRAYAVDDHVVWSAGRR